jgi:glutaryl-CoA dehydrogenase
MATAASTSQFTGVDFLNLDSLLSEDERAVRDTVRSWVDENLIPIIGQAYIEGKFPKQLIPGMAELGLFGANLPEEYGCAGLNNVAYGLIMQELERGDSGIRSFASVQGALVMYPIYAFGSDEQKKQWLPLLASGQEIGCFGLTEPDFGSNPAGMRTAAKRDPGGDWVLNGTKMWITNGSVADVAIVWARTDEGIRGFLVPAGTPGFSAPEIKRKLSLRASVTSELVLDDVRLPADAVLPETRGLSAPLGCLNEARFGIIFGALGAALDCLETALAYAGDREVFDRPLASFQLTQQKLTDMAVEIGKGMLLAVHLGRLKDAGEVTPEQVSVGKLNNVREAIAIARECRTILGANGITLEYPVIRHANNLESVLTYEGTSEVHSLVLGRALTGHAAFQ